MPERVAKILTYPERVTPHNIDMLKKAIRNGCDVHPGANYVTTGSNGFKKYLKFGNRTAIADGLRIGDIVERHVIDGDIVLFNRQPSLHKLSIMCHRVRMQGPSPFYDTEYATGESPTMALFPPERVCLWTV